MAWLGLRLLFANGRSSVVVFTVTALTIALGTALLLLVTAVPGALQAKADRLAWDDWSVGRTTAPESEIPYTSVYSTGSFCTCGSIRLVWVDGTRPGSPVFPGLERNPRPGEVFVSPALKKLMARSPELRTRYGAVTGTVGDAVLRGPDTLMAVRYLPSARMDPFGTRHMTEFATRSDDLEKIYEPGTLGALVTAGGIAALLPILLLLANVVRLSAASREQRLASLRLAGATRGQIGVLTAIEVAVSSLTGVGLGVLIYFGVRPWAAYVSDEERWFVSDLTPDLWIWCVVLTGVPLLAMVSAHLTLRRAAVSPLGAARRTRPVRLTRWRMLPLVLLLFAAAFAATGAASSLGGARLVPGFFFLLVVALLCAGPWLVRALGRLISALPGAPALLAGRRIMDDPRGSFRAVAGIVLAIFIATVFTAVNPAAVVGALPAETHSGMRSGSASASLNWVSGERTAELAERLAAVPGISAVTTALRGTAVSATAAGNQTVWIGDCEMLTVHAKITGCGAADVLVTDASRIHLQENGTALRVIGLMQTVLRPEELSSEITLKDVHVARMSASNAYDMPGLIVSPRLLPREAVRTLRPNLLLLRYETAEAFEHARTVADTFAPGVVFESSGEAAHGNTYGVVRIRKALVAGSLLSFAVAGISLAVVVTVGLLERRRQYTLLRLIGVPVRVLRSAMFAEAAFPLLAGSASASALGLAIAMAMTSAAGSPAAMAWAVLWPPLAGIAGAILMVGLALPPVRHMTETSETRRE